MQDTIEPQVYEPRAGERIRDVISLLTQKALESGAPWSAEINCLTVMANPGDNADDLMLGYTQEQSRKQREWLASPAGQESARQRDEYRQQATAARALGHLPFQVSNQELWDQYTSEEEEFSGFITRYVSRWANLMEQKLEEGEPLHLIAKSSADEADQEGLSGYQRSVANRVIEEVWVHGKELSTICI